MSDFKMGQAIPSGFSVCTYEGCLVNLCGEMINFEISGIRWDTSYGDLEMEDFTLNELA